MAMTEPRVVVSDAGPLIHLDELGCLGLLRDLGPIVLPQEVWAEATSHRPRLTLFDLSGVSVVDVVSEPSMRLVSLADSLDLDAGELAAITLIEGVAARLFLCDDAAARLAAESLGFAVRGTIGVLIRSIRAGVQTRQQVLDLLRELPERSSLHISRQLLTKVIGDVEKGSAGA